MKEATGEANMTVITIVIIALVLAIGTPIVTNLLNNTKESSDCSAKGNVWYGGHCFTPDRCTTAKNGKMSCR